MALLDGLDEPFGRIELLLDERGGFLLLAGGAAHGFHQDVGVALVDLQLGHGEAGHRHHGLAVLEFDQEIGDDLLDLLGIGVVDLSAGTRVEPHDLGDGFLELIFRDAEFGGDFRVVLFGEFGEVVAQDAGGQFDRFGLLLGFELEQQALAQVAGTDADRVEFLDEVEQFLHFVFVGLDAEAEGNVVGQGFQVAAQVAVVVDHADDELGDLPLALVDLAIAQLGLEALVETLPDGEGIVLGLEVLALVVDVEFVRRRGVAAAVFAERDVLLLFPFRGIVHDFLKDRIFLELLLDTLFQLRCRQFDQLDGLDLQRGEPLGLLELLGLLEHQKPG